MANDSTGAVLLQSIVSSYAFLKPQQQEKLYRSKGLQFSQYVMDLRLLGFEEAVQGPTYGHWEENWYHETITALGTTAAGAANATVDVTLSPGDLYTASGGNYYYPKVGDVVMFPAIAGVITSAIIGSIDDTSAPTAPVLTLRPQVLGANIPGITAGDTLIIKTTVFGEYTSGPDPRLTNAVYLENTTQISKQSIAQSGSQRTNETWVKVGEGGENLDTFWGEQMLALESRAAKDIEGGLLYGEQTTNTANVAANGQVQRGTRGLIPSIMASGFSDGVAIGAMTVPNFDDYSTYLEGEDAGNYFYLGMGKKRMDEWENILRDYIVSTDQVYVQSAIIDELYYSDQALGASVAYKYLQKSGRVFCAKKIGSWSDPKRYGATGYNENERMIMLPMNRHHDTHSGEETSSIGLRYKEKDGYNRMMEVISLSGAGPGIKVTSLDGNSHELRSEFGAHQRGVNQMISIYGT
jgi:hypothetical protein